MIKVKRIINKQKDSNYAHLVDIAIKELIWLQPWLWLEISINQCSYINKRKQNLNALVDEPFLWQQILKWDN